LPLPLHVLFLNQEPLNKMFAGAAVIALPLTGTPGARAAAPDVSASKGDCFPIRYDPCRPQVKRFSAYSLVALQKSRAASGAATPGS
jgi:hypothetical protein